MGSNYNKMFDLIVKAIMSSGQISEESARATARRYVKARREADRFKIRVVDKD